MVFFPPTAFPIFAALLVALGFKAIKPAALKSAAKWIILATPVAMLGSCILAETSAERKAKAFCSRFTIDGDFNQAVEAVNEATGTYLKNSYEKPGGKTVYVVYMGIGPL